MEDSKYNEVREEIYRTNVRLTREQEFYANILLQLQKVFVTSPNPVETAAVGRMAGERLTKLFYNLDYMLEIKKKMENNKDYRNIFLGITIHEVLHIVFFHLDISLGSNKKKQNLAMDCVINQLIPADQTMPEWVFPKTFGLPDGKDSLWYYNNITNEQCEDFCNGPGKKGIASHEFWESLNPQERARLKDIIRKAKSQTSEKAWGNLPGAVQEMVADILKFDPPKVCWRQLLRMFCANSVASHLKYTKKRESRRYGTRPGTIRDTIQNIGVCVDTSGSISSENLQEFMREIRHIWKGGADVFIYEADTEVTNSYPFKGSFSGAFHGRGGTDLNPALKFAEGKHDLIVFFTDLECGEVEKIATPTVFVTPGSPGSRPSFGRVLSMKDK